MQSFRDKVYLQTRYDSLNLSLAPGTFAPDAQRTFAQGTFAPGPQGTFAPGTFAPGPQRTFAPASDAPERLCFDRRGEPDGGGHPARGAELARCLPALLAGAP
jgi:hypothetical protein